MNHPPTSPISCPASDNLDLPGLECKRGKSRWGVRDQGEPLLSDKATGAPREVQEVIARATRRGGGAIVMTGAKITNKNNEGTRVSGTQFLNFYFALLNYTDTLFPLCSPLFVFKAFVVIHSICLCYRPLLCFPPLSIHAFTGSFKRTKKQLGFDTS